MPREIARLTAWAWSSRRRKLAVYFLRQNQGWEFAAFCNMKSAELQKSFVRRSVSFNRLADQ